MKKTILSDILAGLTVSFAALSLGAAFGVMSGRGAFAGMIGAAIIPIIASIFGGTRIQASGPTAPMTAVTAVLIAYAYDNFPGDKALAEQYITLVLLLSGLFIILAGIFKLGRFIKLVPQVVVLGFMNGIAVLIWMDQLRKLFGYADTKLEGDLVVNSTIAFGVLITIYLIPYFLRKAGVPLSLRRFLPSIFLTIIIFTIYTSSSGLQISHVELGNTIGSFSEFTDMLAASFPHDSRLFESGLLGEAILLSLQLCLLAYLDSLLTSLVIDKMTKEKTKHDKELIAQGLANGITSVFQGIPGAQATIRSVLLIKEGAKTRLAGILVGVFALLGFLVFSKLIVLIASAVFIGVLLKAGLDVFDRDFLSAYFKNKWHHNRTRNIQLLFIIYTTVVTVLIDLNIAVISATVFYYTGKKWFGVIDAEDDFAEVNSEDLGG